MNIHKNIFNNIAALSPTSINHIHDPISQLVDIVLDGTGFELVAVKRSPITKKLVIHIANQHTEQLHCLNPNKVNHVSKLLLQHYYYLLY